MKEAFKFGKLVVMVKDLQSSDLYQVTLTGMDDRFTTFIHAENHATAANEAIEELLLAAEDPDGFRRRRGMEAEDLFPLDRSKAMALADRAIKYAERNRIHLRDAVRALEGGRARKIS